MHLHVSYCDIDKQTDKQTDKQAINHADTRKHKVNLTWRDQLLYLLLRVYSPFQKFQESIVAQTSVYVLLERIIYHN